MRRTRPRRLSATLAVPGTVSSTRPVVIHAHITRTPPAVRKNGRVYTAQVPADSTAVMGRRFGAFIIDTIIGVVILVVAFMVLSETAQGLGNVLTCSEVRDAGGSNLCLQVGDDIRYADGGTAVTIYGVVALFSFLNAVVLQAYGGSIGKRILGLAVVRRSNGQTLGFGKSIVRWLVSLLDIGCCFLIGLITALATKGHRRLGDMAAGSVVVAKSSVGTVPSFPGNAAAPPPMGGWSPPAAPGGYGAPPAPGQWAPPAPGQWAPPAPPADPWSQPSAPPTPTWNEPAPPVTPAPAPEPVEAAPAVAKPAAGGPQWDAARNAYIQYEPVSGQWMQFDDAAQQWRPLT